MYTPCRSRMLYLYDLMILQKLILISLISKINYKAKQIVLSFNANNAWFNLTCNFAPAPGICKVFFCGGLFPTSGPAEGDNSPPRAPDRPHIRFLLHLFSPYKSKKKRFHNFYERFPEFINYL